MKKRVQLLFVPFVILLLLGSTHIQAQSVRFMDGSLSELERTAQQIQSPYFLYFQVKDCESCSQMKRETFSHRPLVTYTASTYLAKEVNGLDFAQGIDIATRYHVKKYPTTMIFGPDGEVRQRLEGYVDGPMLLTLLQKAVRPSDRGTYSTRGSEASRRPAETRDSYGDRDIANRNPFDSDPNPSYNSESNLVNNDTDKRREDDYDFGVDKKDYLNEYFANRSGSEDLRAKGYTRDDRGDREENLNSSYLDDRGRSTHRDATRDGNYYYKEEKKKPEGQTIQDRYVQESFLDDRSRDPDYVRKNPQPTYDRSGSRYGDTNEGSFLDPLNEGQRTRGGDQNPGQAVNNLEDLPDGTVLKRGPDGKWYIYDEFEGSNDPEQRYRGDASAGRRTAETGTKAVFINETPKSITRSVPGFSKYSPKDLTQNTFGLIVGSYTSIQELQAAMKEFMAHNNSRLWVYSEKMGNVHFYKLAMGEYAGEQQAVSDALRMGASWEDIQVVNLARLR